MNEELQRELLSILRTMKDGSPAVWHELVAQRSGYLDYPLGQVLGVIR